MYRFASLLLCACLGLSACAPAPKWHGTDVTGAMPDLQFQLVDSQGRGATEAQFHGHVTLLFFGFTNCPGPCPTTLAQIGQALAAMGKGRSNVRVMLVTVDPGRDTPAALGRYAASFGPWLRGFTGEVAELERLKKAYGIHADRTMSASTMEPGISHSTAVYAFDARGHCRLLFTDVSASANVAADLLRLERDTG